MFLQKLSQIGHKWTVLIKMNSKISVFCNVNADVKASAAKMGGTPSSTSYAISYFIYIYIFLTDSHYFVEIGFNFHIRIFLFCIFIVCWPWLDYESNKWKTIKRVNTFHRHCISEEQILTSSKASVSSVSCLVATATSAKPSSIASCSRLAIITCSKTTGEPGGKIICIIQIEQWTSLHWAKHLIGPIIESKHKKDTYLMIKERVCGCIPLRASSVAALMLVFIGQALKPWWNFLFGLHQDVKQVFSDVTIFVIEERCCKSCS